MELSVSLIAYVIVVILIFSILKFYMNITIWSSFVFAILVGLILLSVLCPISSVDRVIEKSTLLTAYMFIYFVTVLVIIFYVVDKALRDVSDTKTTRESVRYKVIDRR